MKLKKQRHVTAKTKVEAQTAFGRHDPTKTPDALVALARRVSAALEG